MLAKWRRPAIFRVTQTVGSQGRAVRVRTNLVAEGSPDVGTRNKCISNRASICIAFSILLGDRVWVMMVMTMTDVSLCSECVRYFTCVTHVSSSCDLTFPNSFLREDQKGSERNASGNRKVVI